MSFHLTTEGLLTAITPENGEQENAAQRVVTSRNEWETIADRWPLKRLVAIWNSLPGVTPVQKFTNRQIALERIWRAAESPEQAPRKARTKASKARVQFREGSKAAQAYALLCRPEGATVREMQNATGWQRHTVRGFVSASVRKQGSRVRSFQRGGERVYQVKS